MRRIKFSYQICSSCKDKEGTVAVWDIAELIAMNLLDERLYKQIADKNKIITSTRNVEEKFNGSNVIGGIETGLVYQTWAQYITKMHEIKPAIVRNESIYTSLTNGFDGFKMVKHSKDGSELYILYFVVNELDEEDRFKDCNVKIVLIAEKKTRKGKENEPFSDELLIPFYCQLWKLATEGKKVMTFDGMKHLFCYSLQFVVDIPINIILLGIQSHKSLFGCKNCTCKAVTSLKIFSSFNFHSFSQK